MKRKRYSEEQIISILKQHEAGRSLVDLAREHGVVENTLYRSMISLSSRQAMTLGFGTRAANRAMKSN